MDKKPYPSEKQDRFIVRLPEGMRDLIAKQAKESGRSMNAEIVARLGVSFDRLETAHEAGLLLARMDAALAQAELEKHALALHLGSIAIALIASTTSLKSGAQVTATELAGWADQAKSALGKVGSWDMVETVSHDLVKRYDEANDRYQAQLEALYQRADLAPVAEFAATDSPTASAAASPAPKGGLGRAARRKK